MGSMVHSLLWGHAGFLSSTVGLGYCPHTVTVLSDAIKVPNVSILFGGLGFGGLGL